MARLIGGPFDGDTGDLVRVAAPPPMVYVIACPAGPFCPHGGVHWYQDAEPGTVPYRHTTRDDEVELYVHGGVIDPDRLVWRTEAPAEPVAA